jgi:hypothetical protein
VQSMSDLEACRDDLQRSITESLGLIRTVNRVMSLSELPANISIDQRDFMVEWVFVRIHTAWERFIENCFLLYMLGGRCSSGFAPDRYVFPEDESHALGFVKAGRDYAYIRWTDPSVVKKHASLCFRNGEPFQTVLDLKAVQLQDMNTIRNAVVHQSRDSLDRFKSLVRRELGTASLDATPGKFLTRIKPRTIGTTYLDSYCNVLKLISTRIVPNQ